MEYAQLMIVTSSKLDDILKDVYFKFLDIEPKETPTIYLRYPMSNELPIFTIAEGTYNPPMRFAWYEICFSIQNKISSAKDIDQLIYNEVMRKAPVIAVETGDLVDGVAQSIEYIMQLPDTTLREYDLGKIKVFGNSKNRKNFSMPDNMFIIVFGEHTGSLYLHEDESGQIYACVNIHQPNFDRRNETDQVAIVRLLK